MDTDGLFEEEFESKSALAESILQERSDMRVSEAEMQYLASEHGSRLADYLYDSFGGLGNKARCKAAEEYAIISGTLREEIAAAYRSENGAGRERSIAGLNEKLREVYFEGIIKNKDRLKEILRISKIHALNKMAGLYADHENRDDTEECRRLAAGIKEELKKLLHER